MFFVPPGYITYMYICAFTVYINLCDSVTTLLHKDVWLWCRGGEALIMCTRSLVLLS